MIQLRSALKNEMLFNVVFILTLLTLINNCDSDFVKCIAQCIEFKDCEEAQTLQKEKHITPQICGFNGTEAKVCCSENDEKTLYTFHYGSLRKADKKCKEFNPPTIFRRKDEIQFSAARPTLGTRALSGFPFMAALGFGSIESAVYRCGGFLVEKNVVITAAHCVELNGEPPSVVRVGRYRLSSTETKPIPIRKIIPHPNYDSKTYLNDIAVIILAEDSREKPACILTQRLNLRYDNRTIAVGFGTTSFGGPFTDELIQVYFNIIKNKACEEEYKDQPISSSQLCALGETRYFKNGTSGVQDTCQGDSGGPLVLDRYDDYVVGIVSYGRGCGTEAPGVYTYIAPYTKWIDSVIRQDGNEKGLKECGTLYPPYKTLTSCDGDTVCNSIALIGKTLRGYYLFMVTLGYGDIKNPEYKCDGFFIDNNVVITAAQCAKIKGESPVIVRLSYHEELKNRTIRIVKVIPHPNYQHQTYLNDIAVVFLAENLDQLNKQPACLFTSSLNFNSDIRAVALTSGTTSFDGPFLTHLIEIPTKILDKSVCEKQYKTKPLLDSQLCILTNTAYVAEDTYQGFAGGPIVLENYHNATGLYEYINFMNNQRQIIEPYYVVGIVSYGQGLGVYTNITAHLDWIEATVWPEGTQQDKVYIA